MMALEGRSAYLVYLLGWGLPVVALQLVGLVARFRRQVGAVLVAILPPALLCTVWLSLGDQLAIASGVWHFGAGKHLGIYLGVVPLEEVLFFLITNLLVAQGLALFFGVGRATRSAG